MNCPNCNIDLVIADRQGVEIDSCPQCRGVWLDRGELDKFIERSNAPQRGEHDADWDEHHNYVDERYLKRRRKSFLSEQLDY